MRALARRICGAVKLRSFLRVKAIPLNSAAHRHAPTQLCQVAAVDLTGLGDEVVLRSCVGRVRRDRKDTMHRAPARPRSRTVTGDDKGQCV
jgi:hypothetical protein